MMSPWDHARINSEHSHQVALFQWAAMAENFGLAAADDPLELQRSGSCKDVR
jgi:hypothetical protein